MKHTACRIKNFQKRTFIFGYPVSQKHCPHHGRSHPPFIKSSRYIGIFHPPRIFSNIWNSVQCHAILCCPVCRLTRSRIVFMRKNTKLFPCSPGFSCSMPSAAKQKIILIPAKRKSPFCLIHIHFFRDLCSLKREDIGSMLI